jgi:hypothetical protein
VQGRPVPNGDKIAEMLKVAAAGGSKTARAEN